MMYSHRTTRTRYSIATVGCALLYFAFPTEPKAIELRDAVVLMLNSSAELGEAVFNREAVSFEMEQAQRLYRPNLILEGRIGPEWTKNRTSRLANNDDEVLLNKSIDLSLKQVLFDFGRIDHEIERQAARLDAGGHRIIERSENQSLDVAELYLNILKEEKVLNIISENIAFHQQIISDLRILVDGGRLGVSDLVQAQERLNSAQVTQTLAEERYQEAKERFRSLVGVDAGRVSEPGVAGNVVAGSIGTLVGRVRTNNPTIALARADLETAYAQYRAAQANIYPEISLEGRIGAGDDIGGLHDDQYDAGIFLVGRYEFRGGIRESEVLEEISRVSEARQRLRRIERDSEEAARRFWNTRDKLGQRTGQLSERVDFLVALRNAYNEEFNVGARTLLDILDAQNDLIQAKVNFETARLAGIFADYQLAAIQGDLVASLSIPLRPEAQIGVRKSLGYKPIPETESDWRRYPEPPQREFFRALTGTTIPYTQ